MNITNFGGDSIDSSDVDVSSVDVPAIVLIPLLVGLNVCAIFLVFCKYGCLSSKDRRSSEGRAALSML